MSVVDRIFEAKTRRREISENKTENRGEMLESKDGIVPRMNEGKFAGW